MVYFELVVPTILLLLLLLLLLFIMHPLPTTIQLSPIDIEVYVRVILFTITRLNWNSILDYVPT